jgi:hypothetical protein
MSRESDVFVTNLKASVESWRFPRDTETLYKAKLSKWNLTRDQWAKTLDVIIESNTRGELPSLATIYDEIKRQLHQVAMENNNLGWFYFEFKGHEYARRLKYDTGVWINLNGSTFLPPEGCSNELLCPDKVVLDPREIPTKAEVRGYMAEIWANLNKPPYEINPEDFF